MRQGGHSMRERGLDHRQGMEVFLRFSAYRATHFGKSPPPNSRLWGEHMHLWEVSHPRSFWSRLLQLRPEEPEWRDSIPMDIFPFEISFLNDDFSIESVQQRLQAWPMITDVRLVENEFAEEWFTCRLEVTAENRLHARKIVECIFLLKPGSDPPKIEGF